MAGMKMELGLYDAIGQAILLQHSDSFSLIPDTHSLADGVYFVHIVLGEKSVVKRVVILQLTTYQRISELQNVRRKLQEYFFDNPL
ncbi:MAG: T9SS type A sorting domain-containing protein [Bacteroidetes bacterium]|nr:T9SS type A sorting domain-containing protein [Bacteroidota bacterium]